ncbi:MAG TPA: DUF427 domain-containing protein [Iamia sp.]
MSAGHTVTTTPGDVHVEVVVDGRVVAATDRPVLLEETGLPTRYYVPKTDVRTDLFRPIALTTVCPFKGTASYWTLDLDGTAHDGIAWSYEEPIEAAADIAGHLCFFDDRADVKVG